MRLLPTIIVVSLLAFFLALTLVIFAWRAFTAAERRTKRRNARYNGGPVRQMTIRNGKLIPLPHEVYGSGKEYNSADLSTLRTGESDKSHEKPMPRRNPFTLTPLEKHPKLFGPRDSSPPSDLEAQTHIDPKKFEENLKTLQLLNKHLLQDPQNRVIPRRPETRRKWPGNQSNAVNTKKITESLQKAYNVPSFPSRQMSQVSDYPLSPKSKPVPRHLRRPAQTSSLQDPPNRQASKARSERSRAMRASEQLDETSRSNRQDSGKSFSLPPDFASQAIHSVQAIKVPPPVVTAEIRSSQGRIDSFDGHNPISLFSTTTTKTRNSRNSSAANSLPRSGTTSKRVSTVPSIPPLKLPPALKPPPPTPATTTSSLEKAKPIEMPKPLKPSPPTTVRFNDTGTTKLETRSRPPDIDVFAANATHRTSVLLDDDKTPTSHHPGIPETEIHHGHDQSARSTQSFATFASSDLSSTWTFGNAQRMHIFPSVAPRPVGGVGAESGLHVAPLRPKSKYGRKVKARGMKALPVLPKSPLSEGREDAV
ncbi:MAG: hypothetical protein Q9201_003005 [Fulgogasparrea decipioides]